MKKFYSLLLLLPFIFWTKPAFAHLPGQPPFFKINGTYANYYTVPSTSLPNLDLPQDSPPQSTYLVNQPIHFEIDVNRLPNATVDSINKTKFTWDFADGKQAIGLTAEHQFNKPGSYFVVVNAQDPSVPTPQLLESVLIDVVNNPSQTPPTMNVLVNGNTTDNRHTVTADVTHPLKFSISYNGDNQNILSYVWDFGDGQSSTNATPTHSYTENNKQVQIVVRIRTKDHYMVDNYSIITPGQSVISPTPAEATGTGINFRNLPVFLIIVTIVSLIASSFMIKKEKSKR